MAALWKAREGRPEPFGAYLPQSTEQVLDPPRAFGPEMDLPTELELEPGPGFEAIYGNSFGQGELEVLLEEHLGEEGRGLARGWDGDRYALLKGPGGEEGLVWVSVWDSEAERDRFVSGFPTGPSGVFRLPPRWTRMEVLGRPGAILRVGLPAMDRSGGGTGGRSPLIRCGFGRVRCVLRRKG